MCTGKPLFCGANDTDQFNKIIRIIGTPSKTDWPTMSEYPQFNDKYREGLPMIEGKKLRSVLGHRMNALGLDLIEKMLQPDPLKRISAKDAMRHPFFSELHANANANAAAAGTSAGH